MPSRIGDERGNHITDTDTPAANAAALPVMMLFFSHILFRPFALSFFGSQQLHSHSALSHTKYLVSLYIPRNFPLSKSSYYKVQSDSLLPFLVSILPRQDAVCIRISRRLL